MSPLVRFLVIGWLIVNVCAAVFFFSGGLTLTSLYAIFWSAGTALLVGITLYFLTGRIGFLRIGIVLAILFAIAQASGWLDQLDLTTVHQTISKLIFVQPAQPPTPAKPPIQQTVYQPPYTQPAPRPTPPPVPDNTYALNHCNAQAQQYRAAFATEWPETLRLSRGVTQADEMRAGQKQSEYKVARLQWGDIARSCAAVPGWVNPIPQATVERAMKEDCDVRAKGGHQILSTWPDVAVQLRVPPHEFGTWLENDIRDLRDLEIKCKGLVTGWSLGYDSEPLINSARIKQRGMVVYR